jgi:protein arginine kinase activator
MLCEICKQNEAAVHVTKIVNGYKQEMNICENCAKGMDHFNIAVDGSFPATFSFQNILSGFMDYINQNSQSAIKDSDLVCKNCGTAYSQFRKQGYLGCPECYKNFSSNLIPIIKRVQGNVEHVGKIPQKSGKDIIGRRKLIKLKEDLQKSIAEEEYEKAAQFRDMIRDLQKPE